MRAYPDRAPYVRARFEPGGEELAGITLADMDPSDMHGYADIWPLAADTARFHVWRDTPARAPLVATDVTFHVPRIEPHLNPSWLVPPGGFV